MENSAQFYAPATVPAR